MYFLLHSQIKTITKRKAMQQIKLVYADLNRPMKILVLASGSGTNFEKIHSRQKELERRGDKNYGKLECVFSNNPDAAVLKKAEKLKIATCSLSSNEFFKNLGKPPSDNNGRELYDSAAISLTSKFCKPDLVVLAGYRRKLSRLFIKTFPNRIVNLYPGDTTKTYLERGKSACVSAIENGENSIRCTVYLENDYEKRFGTEIVQSEEISLEGFSIHDSEKMEKKIREQGEWSLFPFAVHDLIANARVAIDGENGVYVDAKKTKKGGLSLC